MDLLEIILKNKLIPCCDNCTNCKWDRDNSGMIFRVCGDRRVSGFEKCEGWTDK